MPKIVEIIGRTGGLWSWRDRELVRVEWAGKGQDQA
jgi:hypothetical protein